MSKAIDQIKTLQPLQTVMSAPEEAGQVTQAEAEQLMSLPMPERNFGFAGDGDLNALQSRARWCDDNALQCMDDSDMIEANFDVVGLGWVSMQVYQAYLFASPSGNKCEPFGEAPEAENINADFDFEVNFDSSGIIGLEFMYMTALSSLISVVSVMESSTKLCCEVVKCYEDHTIGMSYCE